MKHYLLLYILLLFAVGGRAQSFSYEQEPAKKDLGKNIQYKISTQGSFSSDKTPLWLHANKYGLSSLKDVNGYLRASVIRPLQTDSDSHWAVGYGVDVALPYHYTSNIVIQQAFVEARWLHGVLSVGSKEYPMELKNNSLSTGSQALGINARPVPQVRLAFPDYVRLPFSNGWLHIKGHISYGMMTDDNWQHEFTQCKSKYADRLLYHSKAGFLKIGNEDSFTPLSVELGLEMASIFGGTSYFPYRDEQHRVIKSHTGIKSFWKAFMPGGSDVVEEGTVYQNAEGNQLGAWLARINYDADTWLLSVYADKYFEDHSSMFQLDYDGYGTGANWNVKQDKRFYMYDFKDCLLGAELNLRNGSWLRNIVFEYIYTKYQSGPIYHDHTPHLTKHISGNDNFYNHYISMGWQHWGEVMGNALYLSPIYNTDGQINVQNNRFVAYHLGVSGNPTEHLSYRFLATYQQGWGTYSCPFQKVKNNMSFLLETNYRLGNGWNVKGAYAMDFGELLGNNRGVQVTVCKTGCFSF